LSHPQPQIALREKQSTNSPSTVSQSSLVLAKPIPVVVVRAGTLQDGTAMGLDQSAGGVGHVDLRIESSVCCSCDGRTNGQGCESHMGNSRRGDHRDCRYVLVFAARALLDGLL
jgi:hypothetical protein